MANIFPCFLLDHTKPDENYMQNIYRCGIFSTKDTIITNFSLESVARCLFFSFLSPPSSLLSYSFSINGSYFRKLKIYQFLNSILKDSDSISLWCEGLQNVFVSKSLNFSSLNILHGEWRTLH